MKITNLTVIIIIWAAIIALGAFIGWFVLFALFPAYYLTKYIIEFEGLEIQKRK